MGWLLLGTASDGGFRARLFPAKNQGKAWFPCRIQHHQFAVDYPTASSLQDGLRRHIDVGAGNIPPFAVLQLHAVVVNKGQCSDAVPFHLEKIVRVIEGFRVGKRLHRQELLNSGFLRGERRVRRCRCPLRRHEVLRRRSFLGAASFFCWVFTC
ncbi:conserved hypothetical protein [Heliomicrobium modesticaldum Ice1]|uniref:Uncharacterized protein n=1 Tax=Heliobacterium modesticaldum (strain ATCC 51547 / Ice1) TaxID=498761 RepID=B0TIF1_HELMI|nr:conserved hypothetical protein [Heliomicrobium modesticaldum Ice1]